jgi:hypothetical protein
VVVRTKSSWAYRHQMASHGRNSKLVNLEAKASPIVKVSDLKVQLARVSVAST